MCPRKPREGAPDGFEGNINTSCVESGWDMFTAASGRRKTMTKASIINEQEQINKLWCSQMIKVSAEKSNRPEPHMSTWMNHAKIMVDEKPQAVENTLIFRYRLCSKLANVETDFIYRSGRRIYVVKT